MGVGLIISLPNLLKGLFWVPSNLALILFIVGIRITYKGLKEDLKEETPQL